MANRDEASLHNWVLANQRMAASAQSTGMNKFGFRHSDFGFQVAYRYVLAEAAGHTDERVTRQTPPGALEWLWQGYPVK